VGVTGHLAPAEMESRPPSSDSAGLPPRWRMRVRLEDERRAALRSAVAVGDNALEVGPSGEPRLVPDWQLVAPDMEAALSALESVSSSDSDRLDETICEVIAVLDKVPVFRCRELPDGSASSCPSSLVVTDAFIAVLREVVPRVRGVSPGSVDLVEAVARRISNGTSSFYEHPAAAVWPVYAERSPGLSARFQLAQSGLVSYSLAAGLFGASGSWELAGEGCWKVLPADGQPTEVVLEMRQGLEGTAPVNENHGRIADVREPPCTLRFDLRECVRVGEEEDAEEEDDEEDEDEEEDG